MTSPVDTSVKFFTSRMLGAPVLTGQAGSLIAILDACLVNGWGIQTATSLVVSGGVATLTFPLDHAAPVEAVILVAGSSIADLNGEQKVTVTAPNVVKFATDAADGTATGTITAKMAPAGFNKPFSGTNLAVYKSAHAQANGHFLRVNDTNAIRARANGYENMTAISTGTGLFPTSVQLSGGLYWPKSVVAGTAPVEWVLAGDGRFFTFFPSTFQSNGVGYEIYTSSPMMAFGDPVNLSRAPDPFSTLTLGYDTESSADSYSLSYPLSEGSPPFRYMARAIAGTGAAVQATIHPMSSIVARDQVFDRASGQISFSEHVVKTNATASWRAKLPGVYQGESTYMEAAFSHMGTFRAGTPERTYLGLLAGFGITEVTALHLFPVDITGPWR